MIRSIVLFILLSGCRSSQQPLETIAIPPADTREACAQIRAFFSQRGSRSVSPAPVTTRCQMRVTSEPHLSGRLMKHLEETKWVRDRSYGQGAVPYEFAYETPATRCRWEERPNHDGGDDRLGASGGVGVQMGSGGFGVGVGLGLGGRRGTTDYLIECADKP